MFAFGGVKSTDPLVWAVRASEEVRRAFFPRMEMKENAEAIRKDEEKAKRRNKRAERARKFKEIVAKSGSGAEAGREEQPPLDTRNLNRRPKNKR